MQKVLKELAIFRHFYFLNRKQALNLPKWEWESLIEQYYALKAEDRMHQLYAAGLGFSGGEGMQTYLKNLEQLVDGAIAEPKQTWKTATGKAFRELDQYTTEEDLTELDGFLSSVGL